MFGISPLGWVHTLGSLPAIPAAVVMFARHGGIVPRSRAGAVYFASMLLGAITALAVSKDPVGEVIAVATFAALMCGYGLDWLKPQGRIVALARTVVLTFTMLCLLVPTVTEILRRVPDGHPFVTDPRSPVLLGAQGAVLAMFLITITVQAFVILRRPGTDALR